MKLRELRRLLKIWAKRLRVDDWELNVKWGKPDNMTGEGVQGNIFFEPEFRRALIVLLALKYREEEGDSPEEDLIHELLHLVLQGHGTRMKYDAMFERGLNQIAHALYTAYSL